MRIAMLLHKSVEHDSRVRREAGALAGAGHRVTVVHLPRTRGEPATELDGCDVVSATPPAWVRNWLPFHLYRLAFFACFVRKVRAVRPDVVHAHDAAMLAPGLAAARLAGAKLVYDSHEYAAGVPYRERGWALLVRTLERVVVPRCAAVITVSDGIAERLRQRYGRATRTAVVRNFPDREAYDWTFEAPDLRAELAVGDHPLVIHQGAVARDRGCENLVGAMALLPDWHLLCLGADDTDYTAGLRALAAGTGIGARVHFRESVPIAQLPAYTRRADVGVSLLQPTCENHRLALPNKAFEYLMCGVPVVASDLPELRRLLGPSPVCRLADPDDAEDVARALRDAVGDGPRPLEGGAGGCDDFSWTSERERLLGLYAQLEPVAAEPSRRRRALVLVRNPCTHDARVLREVGVLDRAGYDTLVVGVVSTTVTASAEDVAGVRVLRLAPRAPASWLRRWVRRRNGGAPTGAATDVSHDGSSSPPKARALVSINRFVRTLDYYRRAVGAVLRARPALVHCNDYNTAWIGVAAKALCGSAMVYDAHELWPDRNLRPEPRWWLLLCESLFVRVADRTITTSPGYAAVIARRYRVREPQVVRNIPSWGGAANAAWNGDRTAVYFGAITQNRGLQTAVEALTYSPQLRLRMIGPDAWGYREVLARSARRLGVDDRLELEGAVAPEHARQALAGAAVGLALIEPACLSYRLTLPNKLFEYTLAGVPILAGDVPVTADFVRERSIGLVSDPRDPAAVAAALEQMLEVEAQVRFRQAVAAAQGELSWASEGERLAAIYRGAQAGSRDDRSATFLRQSFAGDLRPPENPSTRQLPPSSRSM